MAREYARVKVGIWGDPDFRLLTPDAQHLYFLLLTSPSLNLVGVADWRPNRIAALAGGWTARKVKAAGDELQGARYLIIDEDTEEVLIRSFVRHDGVLKSPKTGVALANDFAALSSRKLMEAVALEVARAADEDPSLKGLVAVEKVLHFARDTQSDTQSDTQPTSYPLSIPIPQPSALNQQPATSSPQPSSSARSRAAAGTRIPDDFTVTPTMREWASTKGFGQLNLEAITEEFIDYWRGVPGSKGVKLDWHGTWRNRVREVAGRAKLSGASRVTEPRSPWDRVEHINPRPAS